MISPDDDGNDESDQSSAKAELALRRDVDHQDGPDHSDKRPAKRDRFSGLHRCRRPRLWSAIGTEGPIATKQHRRRGVSLCLTPSSRHGGAWLQADRSVFRPGRPASRLGLLTVPEELGTHRR